MFVIPSIWDSTSNNLTYSELVQKIDDSNGDISNLTLWVDNTTLNQIHGNAVEMGVEVGEFRKNEYGIQIRDLYLPTATVHIAQGQFIPEGTAFLLNFDAIAPVEQPTPGKGNFFLEELAKTGAGEKYQIFGQIGLDYGNEALHGKITGLSTTFTKPEGKKVVVVSEEEIPSY